MSHLEQEVRHSAFFIAIGTVLAVGALSGIALSIGSEPFGGLLRRAHWAWLPIALGASIASYVGYVFAYRETAGADGVPLTHIRALVAGGFGLFIPLGDLVAVALLRRRNDLRRSPGWRARLANALDGVAETMRLWRRPQYGLLAFLGMAVYWAADIFVLWACIAVFSGRQPGVAAIIIGYATGYALTRRALPLAGAGAVEALLPFALSWTGT